MSTDERDKQLETDHLDDSLERDSVRGGLIQTVARILRTIFDVGATMVLARLLTPEDFGLIGMIVSVTSFLGMIKDMGLTKATVQRDNITHAQVNTLFWINLAISLGLTAAAMLMAPVLAWFYKEPLLVNLTLVYAASLLFGSLGLQHQAILQRKMRFGALAGTQLASTVVGISVALYMAFTGWGYWALVGSTLASTASLSLGFWILCRWRPSLPSIAEDTGELVQFGANLTGFNITNYFARNLDDVMIGRVAGAESLGLYRKAYQLFKFPLDLVAMPVQSVALPMMSRMVDDPERYRRTYNRILEKLVMVTMPMATYLMVSSDWLILTVLGDQWERAIPIFFALSVGVIYQPIGHTAGWLYTSQGRTDEMFTWGLVSTATVILAIAIGLPWGAFGVAAAYTATGITLRFPLLVYWVSRSGPIPTRDFYRTPLPILFAALGAGVGTFLIRQALPMPPLLGLVVNLLALSTIYLALLSLLPSGRAAISDAFSLGKLALERDD